jgi:hypothetical protein
MARRKKMKLEDKKKVILALIMLFLLYVVFFLAQPMAILALVFVFFIALGLLRPNFTRGRDSSSE